MGCGASSKDKYVEKNNENSAEGTPAVTQASSPVPPAPQSQPQAVSTAQPPNLPYASEPEPSEVSWNQNDNEEDDWVDELPQGFAASAVVLQRRRFALSAEAYGDWNRPPDFEPESVPKSQEQAIRIRDALLKSPFMASLAGREEDLQIAINSFRQVLIEAGQEVIQQGAPQGREFFLVESGRLDVHHRGTPAEAHPGPKVAGYEPGQSFGELALLYNAPRAATVVATEPCTLWSLSREAFNTVMRDNEMRRRERHMGFLRSVKLLEPLDNVEIGQVADVVVTETFSKGDFIVREGEIGQCFYIVEEGEAVARINNIDARSYKRGAYFGELALVNDRPRAADVVACSEGLRVVRMDRSSFKRLLGPKALFKDSSAPSGPASAAAGPGSRRRVSFGGGDDPEPKATARRGTGFVDKTKLRELLAAAEEEDEDEASGHGRLSEQSNRDSIGEESSGAVGVRFADDTNEDDRAKLCKRGTGFIHVEQLKKLLADCEDADEDEESSQPTRRVQFDGSAEDDDKAPNMAKRGTGFIHADQLKKMLAESDAAEENDGSTQRVTFDAGPENDNPKKLKKRGTGYVQADQLKKMLAACEDDNEDDQEEQFDEPPKESLCRYSGMAVYINQDQLRRSLQEAGEEVDF